MAQKLVDFKVQPVPVQSTGTTQFTAASFDMAAIPGQGNVTDCCIFIRSKVLKYEAGGGTYTQAWERTIVFRRTTTGNPVKIGNEENGNAASAGMLGDLGLDTMLFDVSGTTIRLRVTPQSGTNWWWVKLEVMIVQPA